MNILVLHAMGNPKRWLHSVATFELGMPRYAPEHNYLVHNTSLPLPDYVKRFPFDLIVINSSLLTSVFDRGRLQTLKADYGFIADSSAFKVALPQDDYYCCEELDQLVTDWKIDLLYTVCPEYWDILYPKYSQSGGMIKLGFTGYITPEMLIKTERIKSDAERKFDVTYRASGTPSFPNKLALLKANLGNIFTNNIPVDSLKFDIASGKSSIISGSAWWDFIENSRCVLGSLSGSSNLIRNHEVVDKIRHYQREHPNVTNDEIFTHCIPSDDATRIYEAISPRIIEAGLLGAVQLLVPGSYSGILTPYVDYMPTKGDLLEGGTTISNKEEIIELLRSSALREKLSVQCKKTILGAKQLHLNHFFAEVFEVYKQRRGNFREQNSFKALSVKYSLMMKPLFAAKFFAGNAIRSFKKVTQ